MYRLYGRVDGERIRKNFATRAEAEAERPARELTRLQEIDRHAGRGDAPDGRTAPPSQSAFALIQGKPQPLLFYVDFALKNYRAPEHEKPLADALRQ